MSETAPGPGLTQAQAQAQQPKIKITSADIDTALMEAPVEEHFILRLPQQLADNIRPLVKSRNVPADFNLTFKDARTGKLSYKNKSYNTTLVDLPCITESLKTIDSKQFYKIQGIFINSLDVSQMLIVHENLKLKFKDHAFPDGLTDPLKDVRNSRFRKRMNKKVIEDVEAQVERLLSLDLESEEVRYEVHERKDTNSIYDEDEEASNFVESDNSGDENDDFDLGAAIDEVLVKNPQEESEDDEEEEEEEDDNLSVDNNEPEDENNEFQNLIFATKNEITALESKVSEKKELVANQINPIMKVFMFFKLDAVPTNCRSSFI